MIVKQTEIDGVLEIVPDRIVDRRGDFCETYNRQKFRDAGINTEFVQDNHSRSMRKGTLRGLHFQHPPHAQAKLVRCIRGAVFDVAVDIRVRSPSFGQWVARTLSAENDTQLFIPDGFAHGFVTLEPNCEVLYKCSNHHQPSGQGGILWNDPDLGILWPISDPPILSEKDTQAPTFATFESPFT